jgi:hypothetical protein
MPELEFSVTGAGPVVHGLSPMLRFQVHISARFPSETIQALILQSQIQFQPARRSYSANEKERLSELFGPPSDWGRTLRNRLWAHASTTASTFTGSAEVGLMVPCTYDMNLAATKYFYALEGQDIPLLFLFSGSIFYPAADGRLQVQPISWEKEAEYRLPVDVWRRAMDCHYPNSAWIPLRKDVFDRLVAYRRLQGSATWEQTLEALLEAGLPVNDTTTMERSRTSESSRASERVPSEVRT